MRPALLVDFGVSKSWAGFILGFSFLSDLIRIARSKTRPWLTNEDLHKALKRPIYAGANMVNYTSTLNFAVVSMQFCFLGP